MTRLAGSKTGRWASFVWGAFAAGCGVAFATSLAANWVVPVACVSVAVALILAALIPGRALGFALVSVAIAVGLLRGASAVVTPGPGTINGHLGVRAIVIEGTVRSADPGSGTTAIIDASHLSDADTDGRVSGGVLVSGPLIPALAPGDKVEIDASGLRPLYRRPGADSAETLEREDVEAIATSPQVFVTAAGGPSPARWIAWVQGRLLSAVNQALPEPGAALTLGIAFGIHEPLSDDVRTSLQNAGLIHIVVVSGLKIVLALGLVGAVARVFEWSRRRTLLVRAAPRCRIRAHQRRRSGSHPQRADGECRDVRCSRCASHRSGADARACCEPDARGLAEPRGGSGIPIVVSGNRGNPVARRSDRRATSRTALDRRTVRRNTRCAARHVARDGWDIRRDLRRRSNRERRCVAASSCDDRHGCRWRPPQYRQPRARAGCCCR